MSGYKSFAVAGAGNIGAYIVQEFAELKRLGLVSEIRVLTRSASGVAHLTDVGAEVIAVDYASPSDLVFALSGVDVVISALARPALGEPERALAVASKQAGARLFIPSDFGSAIESGKGETFAAKEHLRRKLQELDLPCAMFYTGPFSDYALEFIGFDLPNGKAEVGGSGNTPISWTERTDIARFVVHALTAFPTSELENKVFRIEGERTSFNTILKEYSSRTGIPMNITYIPHAELEARFKADSHDFAAILMLEWDRGYGVVGKPEEVSNGLWKEWNPKRAIDGVLPAWEEGPRSHL